jgi:hypothetical protein
MKLKPSKPIQLDQKADHGRIWLIPWLQNMVKTSSFGPIQFLKIRSKLDEIQLKFSKNDGCKIW